MKSHRLRFLLLLLLALALAAVAAGCGGDDDDDEEGAGDTAAATGEEGEAVSGSIRILALWTAGEQESFQAVLDGFKEQNPDVNITYNSAEDVRPVLSTAIEGGNPPDLAALPNPGLMRDFVERGALKDIEFARDTVEENFAESWVDLASVDDQLYGVFFKGANKSTVWYNVQAFEDAGIEPAEDWETLLENAQTLKQSGVPAWSIGGADGWTLTDWFENLYLRIAGPEKYDQLAEHEIPWTDPSVIDALTEFAKVLSDPENIAGGTQGALQTNFPESVTQVFQDPPKAAIVYEGDFVAGVITTETQAEAETGFNVFDFPSVNDSDPAVVGGGDMIVKFTDNPAADALVEYLATAEAAEIWAERGGFSSPNKNVDPEVYPDEILRTTASALAEAETFRFDLSDLTPSAFGGDSMFTILQDFLQNPDDVQGTAQKLEQAAAQAYGS
ncbi:MAG TPA: ABC transporter substrate-binding protein [Candidatus Limnocylindrales bacterium]|nr:ABC transporter substrate-binding protein [Candidatus Limnocylindrales bacterium]